MTTVPDVVDQMFMGREEKLMALSITRETALKDKDEL